MLQQIKNFFKKIFRPAKNQSRSITAALVFIENVNYEKMSPADYDQNFGGGLTG